MAHDDRQYMAVSIQHICDVHQASSQHAFVGTLIVSLVPSSDILGLKSGAKGGKVRNDDDLYYYDELNRAPRAARCTCRDTANSFIIMMMLYDDHYHDYCRAGKVRRARRHRRQAACRIANFGRRSARRCRPDATRARRCDLGEYLGEFSTGVCVFSPGVFSPAMYLGEYLGEYPRRCSARACSCRSTRRPQVTPVASCVLSSR